MRNVRVAAIQMQCAKDVSTNIQTAERLVRQAAERRRTNYSFTRIV